MKLESLVTGYWLLVSLNLSLVIRHLSFVIRLRHSSFVTRHSSFNIRHSTFVLPHPQTPLLNERGDMILVEVFYSEIVKSELKNSFRHSSFVIHHSSFVIHHSSFIIHHSSFVIHHSFVIRHSSFKKIVNLLHFSMVHEGAAD